MARQGEVLESTTNGQRAVFRETAKDTGGELLRLDFFVAPGGFLGNEHLHPKQEERIKVRSGTLRCRVGGREWNVGPDQTVVIPPNIPHTLWNESGEEAHALVEYRPALRMRPCSKPFSVLDVMGRLMRVGPPTFCKAPSCSKSTKTSTVSPDRRYPCRRRFSPYSRH